MIYLGEEEYNILQEELQHAKSDIESLINTKVCGEF